MKRLLAALGATTLGILIAIGFALHAQSGGGPEGGGGRPGGSLYSTQYSIGSSFGGAGPGTAGHVLTSNGAGMAPTFQAAGGGTPAGSDTQLQFNNAGAFGASADLAWVSPTLNLGQSDVMVVNGATITAQLQNNASGTYAAIESHSHQGAGGLGPIFYGARSRGTTSAPTVVAADDPLASLYGVGYDGTDYATSALIQFLVDGTPGANDMPGRITFWTSPDGSQTLAERLRIANNGAWGLAGANYGTSGQVLTSNGSASPPTWQAAAGGGNLFVKKTADTTRTNNTVSDDPVLTLTAVPAGTYIGTVYLIYTTDTTPGFRAGLRSSQAMSQTARTISWRSSAGTTTMGGSDFATGTATTNVTNLDTNATNQNRVEGTLLLVNPSSTDFAIQWAQTTTTGGTNTVLLAGSWLRLEKVE